MKQETSYKPLVEWVLLWILGMFAIGIRNDLKLMGKLSSFVDIIISQLYVNLIVVPVVLVVWFLMKFVLRKIGKVAFVEDKNSFRNVFIVWLILFGFIFLRGF